MLLKRSLSLFLCAVLTLSLCVFALPRTARARTVQDNPAGTTKDRVSAGDTMANNFGTLNRNNGTVTLNAVTGTVTNNCGTMSNNQGAVTVNDSTGTVVNNMSGGTVNSNFGEVTNNNGTVTYSEGTGTVQTNNNGGNVANNNGTVEINNGTVTSNYPNRTVGFNNGTVKQNSGTVGTNNSGGTVGTNNGTGVVNSNHGTVTTNKSGGTVGDNRGTVTDNKGTVTTNNSGGTVTHNNGTVGTNNGAVISNNSGATVGDNNSTVTTNNGTVTNNNGTVENNSGTVKTNSSLLYNNGGTVTTNASRGFVVNYSGTVTTNLGIINNYDGTVTNNQGTVNYYYKVEFNGTGVSNMEANGLFNVNNARWAANDGTVTLTPNSGYAFTAMPSTTSGTITPNGSGGYTLTGLTGNAVVTVNVAALTAPAITGDTAMTLAVGYAARETNAYTISGLPAPTVTFASSSDGIITWNDTTKKINVAPGLPVGSYTAVLTATNSQGTKTHTLAITVSNASIAPAIVGDMAMSLTEGYAAASTNTYNITGLPEPTVTFTSSDNRIAWNNTTKKFDVAAGLSVGSYTAVLTATNDVGAAGLTLTVTVNPAPVAPDIEGPTDLTLTEGYAATSTDPYTVTGTPPVSVTMQPGPTNGYVTWNEATHRLDIAPGLSAGSYIIGLLVSNNVNTITRLIRLTVTAAPVPPAPASPGGSSSISGGGAYTGNQYPGSFAMGANGAPVLTVQAPCEKCISVIVDGVQLKENADYTKACGSTIITFTPSYLATLANGAHSIRVQFTDGRYDGNFVTPFAAQLATAPMASVPATGDAPLWAKILDWLR